MCAQFTTQFLEECRRAADEERRRLQSELDLVRAGRDADARAMEELRSASVTQLQSTETDRCRILMESFGFVFWYCSVNPIKESVEWF